MAGAAKESLSPLIRNVQVRRLSVELCQKIGSQLLSPLSPARNAQIGKFFQSADVKKSPISISPGQPNRRRSSGCITPIANAHTLGFQSQFGNGNQNQRRRSLTPGLGLGFTSTNIPRIEIQEATTANDENDDTFGDIQEWNDTAVLGGNRAQIPIQIISSNKLGSSIDNFKEEKENLDPNHPSNIGISRRKSSSSARHDFDETFVDFVYKKFNLHLQPDEILGRGSFGTVISGIYKAQPVAVKVISTKTATRADSLQGEKIAFELPKNPNVTQILDILKVQMESIEGDRALVIMEKLRPGNLLTLLNDNNAIFDIPTCLRVSAQITSGLLFCHQLGILHLDVKPQNILIDYAGQNCKLSDFGNARRVSDLGKNCKFVKLEGTVIYKAPELFRGFCPTEKSDIFSLGITMWQILSREFPYQGETEHSVIYKVVAQGLRPRISPNGQPQFKLCEICWDQDPDKRPNTSELLDRLNFLQVQAMQTYSKSNNRGFY